MFKYKGFFAGVILGWVSAAAHLSTLDYGDGLFSSNVQVDRKMDGDGELFGECSEMGSENVTDEVSAEEVVVFNEKGHGEGLLAADIKSELDDLEANRVPDGIDFYRYVLENEISVSRDGVDIVEDIYQNLGNEDLLSSIYESLNYISVYNESDLVNVLSDSYVEFRQPENKRAALFSLASLSKDESTLHHTYSLLGSSDPVDVSLGIASLYFLKKPFSSYPLLEDHLTSVQQNYDLSENVRMDIKNILESFK